MNAARVALARFILLAAILAWPLAAVAAGINVPPTPDHHVTDGSGALSSDARTALENELTAYEAATGHQVLVWIGQSTGDVPLETWTSETADRWKIGRHGHDDGAILFLFMADHKIRIEVGYGLEGALPDADAHHIIENDITPRMKAGDVDGAVQSGVAAMLATITPSFKVTQPPPMPIDPSAILHIIIPLLFGAFVLLLFIMRIVAAIRYGYLIKREGKTAARRDMGGLWALVALSGGSGGGSSSSFGGGGGGFSAGGGSFGGGGASGGW